MQHTAGRRRFAMPGIAVAVVAVAGALGGYAGIGPHAGGAAARAAVTATRHTGAIGPVWRRATAIKLPASANLSQPARFYAVGCASTGYCVAGGAYLDAADRPRPMIAVRSGGRWGPARDVLLPSDAAAEPEATVNGASCGAPKSCVAVGNYLPALAPGDDPKPFIARKSSAGWSRAVPIRLPADRSKVPNAFLQAVSCTAPGYCTALGAYQDTAGSQQAMAVTEAKGLWAVAMKITAPADSAKPVGMIPHSISCPSTGHCVATGTYSTGTANLYWRAADTKGKWSRAVALPLPANADKPEQDTAGSAVSCPALGSCTVLADYVDTSQTNHIFQVKETGGSWGKAFEIMPALPADAGNPANPNLGGIACAPKAPCVAVGGYTNKSELGIEADVLVQVKGKWQLARTLLPANAATGGSASAFLYAVSCWGTVHCAAAGSYAPGHAQARPMAVTTK
jgi:hypothetical protein